MKATLVDENKNLVWSDVADPIIKDDEVLVKIYAAALNRADLLQRQGKYPSPAGCPEWMGLEIAGVVVATGKDVTNWKVGDRVCALLGGGGYAEYVAVKHDMLMPVPKGLSLVEAAALPEAYATSYLNLFIEGHLEAGQTAFIPAGASGLASFAIPMAKAFGARVITSVLSDEIAEKMQRATERAFAALKLDIYSRADFLLDEKGDIYCLEMNTLPGMTATSLLPQEAKAAGMEYGELCEFIIQKSLERYNA
jgi:NADPH2:quinone reductase